MVRWFVVALHEIITEFGQAYTGGYGTLHRSVQKELSRWVVYTRRYPRPRRGSLMST